MKTCDFLKFYTLYFSGGIWLPISKGVSLAVDPLGMRTFDLLTVSLVESSAAGAQSQFACYVPTLPTFDREVPETCCSNSPQTASLGISQDFAGME